MPGRILWRTSCGLEVSITLPANRFPTSLNTVALNTTSTSTPLSAGSNLRGSMTLEPQAVRVDRPGELLIDSINAQRVHRYHSGRGGNLDAVESPVPGAEWSA